MTGTGRHQVDHGAVYDPARHRALRAEPWSAEATRAAVDSIVDDFRARGREGAGWPTHPLDSPSDRPLFCAYDGAAGAVTALHVLRRLGVDAPDRTGWIPAFFAAWQARPDHGYETGLQLGEVGLLASAAMSEPGDPSRTDRLLRSIGSTIGHPAHEITSGATGAMHAARALYRRTGDDRWRAAWLDCAESLLAHWKQRPESGLWLWRNEIFGSVRGYFGACHGVAGNAGALLEGSEWLSDDLVRSIVERTVSTLEAGAIRSGPDVGWPVSADPSGGRRLVQWCHGAPGVVAALGRARARDPALQSRLDALLEAAGELVWKAGPLAKGPGLCHGTAGNGYAFLALHGRSGSALWLDRARRFAMHAIAQRERARARYGRGRYTLWTGDGGLAVYLQHCIEPADWALPGLSLF
ncbi:MAG: lanthionine synthetase C family protein [Myxococcota bacterium]